MKRFLVIFAICFASIIGIFGGVFGIKYLKGDFKEVVINPENIAFELDEYDVTDDFKITITTTTEDVTATKVTLKFVNGAYHTYGKDHWTDGVIIIPKEVKLNVAFDVKLCRTNDSELDDLEWIKGGISNIIASSECITTPKVTASIYVDVPVYKTEMVLFDGKGTINKSNDYKDVLTYIEGQTNLAKKLKADEDKLSFNAGDTFYLGLKFYPARSAYKYSKASSTNMLVEYYDAIINKLSELNLDYTNELNNLKTLLQTDKTTKEVDFQDIINTYQQIINIKDNSDEKAQLVTYLNKLNTEFAKKLKYYTFEEKVLNSKSYINKIEKVAGTNLYKLQTKADSTELSDLINVELYSYTFFNSAIENNTTSVAEDYLNLLDSLEKMYTQQGQDLKTKKVDKQTIQFNIVDIDVDTVNLAGSINDFLTNSIHTIYVGKDGTNNANTSYLKTTLSNSNIETVNLQNKILNIGIRFEKRLSSNSWGASDEISFVDAENYTKVKVVDSSSGSFAYYYLPVGNKLNYNNAYWQIYSDNYIANDFRAVLVYIRTYNLNEENVYQADIENTLTVVDNPLFRLTPADNDEKLVGWKSLDDLTLGVVDMTGVIDLAVTDPTADGTEATKDVSYNKEVDLAKLVNIPETNNFQTYKFFIYSDDEQAEQKLSYYFTTVDANSKPYTLKGIGITKNLYELDGSILKLKRQEVPSYSVNVIFATIRTGALRNPIMVTNGDYEIYDIVKYSATKESLVENLSYLSVQFTNSLKTLKADVAEINSDYAGIAVTDGLFKMAHNTNNLIRFKISGGEGDNEIIRNALMDGTIRMEARESKNNATNYITFNTSLDADAYYITISTTQVLRDTQVKLYLIYTVDGNDYLFPVSIAYNNGGGENAFYNVTIVKDTNSEVSFNFALTDDTPILSSEIDHILVSTIYNATSNKYEKTYSVYYKDAGSTENPAVVIFGKDSRIKIKIVDFLGNVDTETQEGWFLKSSNLNVIVVQNNQFANFVGETTADKPVTLSLYSGTLENNVLCESVNFVVENSGRVDEVIKYYGDANERLEFKYDEVTKETYKFPTQNLSLEREQNNEIALANLLLINYKLGETSNPLTMDIYIANEASLNVLQQISDNTTITIENYKTTPISSFKLTKMLGSVVKLDLSYVCKELDITQSVSLKLSQIYSINKTDVKNIGNTSVTKSDSIYNVYKGIPYTLELETENISASKSLYYYLDGEEPRTFNVEENRYTINFTFGDSSSAKRQIYITSVNSTEENDRIGELVYCIDFNVMDNIVVNVKHPTISLKGNTISIPFIDLLARKDASGATLAEYPLIYNNITFDAKEDYAQDNLKLSISGPKASDTLGEGVKEVRYIDLTFSEFTNEANIKFYIIIDELIIGQVSLKVLPESLISQQDHFAIYKGIKAIIVSNSEVISDDNDATNLFTKLFSDKDGVQVVYDYAVFNGTYTTKSGTIRKVTLSNNNLFTNTDTFVTVTESGVSTKYLIVISRLKFPFVKFVDVYGNELAYNNLDINRLFETTDTLYEYYKANNIKFFTTTLNEETNNQELVLIKNNENLVYNSHNRNNIFNITDAGVMEMATGTGLAGSYATLQSDEESIKLTAKPIGVQDGVYLKVSLKLAQAGTNTYFYIPIIIHLNQTQNLVISYPNSGAIVGLGENGYGCEEYDADMLNTQLPFNNKLAEYLSFNEVYGKAQVNLTNGKYTRFIVNELDAQNNFSKIDYTGEYHYSIEKIVKNVGGVWSPVDKNDFANYASITLSNGDAMLVVNKYNGLNVARLKIKITTDGGAENYVYVYVGESEQLTLMRQAPSSSQISIGAENNITLKSDEVFLIGSGAYELISSNAKYYYYLTNINYNQELKFRLVNNEGKVIPFDSDENTFVTVDSNKLTIEVQPTGENFKLELYTLYGVLSVLNVTVEPAFKFTLKEVDIYSGTAYELTELVLFTTDVQSLTSFTITNIANTDNSKYFSCETSKIVFIHIAEKVAFNLVLTITITNNADIYEFDVTFKNIMVLPRVTSLYPHQTNPFIDTSTGTESEQNLTTKTADDGKISLSKDFWSILFTDNKLNSNLSTDEFADGTQLFYLINNKQVSEKNDYEYNVDAITSVITQKVQFTLATKKADESYTIVATAYVMLTINPQYKITMNYPIVYDDNGEETTLGYELVQNKGSIDFSAKTFNNNDRLLITNMAHPEQTVTYNIKLGDTEVPVSGQYMFTFADTEFVNGDITQEFDIYINNLRYGTYVVKVRNESPIGFIQAIDTVYVSYGDDDVFKKVEVIVTMPNITLEAGKEKVSLYVADQAGVSSCEYIAKDIYYRAGEKIRCTFSIKNYNENVTKVFVATDSTSTSINDTQCFAQFNVRGKLNYDGKDIRYKDYEYVIGTLSLLDDEMTGNSQTLIKSLDKAAVCTIVSDKSIVSALTLNLIYDVQFDEELVNKTKTITLNANEQDDGYSFVELFALKDTLGNTFWLNHTSNNKEMTLKITDTISSINCLPITPVLKDNIRYDYNLKPLGASNDGTYVNVSFTYTIGENRKYEMSFTILVKSDIEYILHNESISSVNSETNPLVIEAKGVGEKILLASEKQTTYIYAYSKYSTLNLKPNVVGRWTDPQVAGDKEYINVTKENGAIYLNILETPNFGNKNLIITFQDPYNFTFKYYVEFTATVDVVSYSVDSQKVYEGDSFEIYNRNKKYDKTKSGVGIVVKSGNDTDITSEFYVANARFVKDGRVYDIIAVQNNGYKPTGASIEERGTPGTLLFKYLSYDSIWKDGSLNFSGSLELSVQSVNESGAISKEVYTFTVPFALYKKYRTSISAENTFVRENVEIDLEHFIDVYDYSQSAYLGKPELSEYEAIQNEFNLANIFVDNSKTMSLKSYAKNQLKLISEQNLILNNNDASQKDKDDAQEKIDKAWDNLRTYGITPNGSGYELSNMRIIFRIKAKNKATSNMIAIEKDFIIKVANEGKENEIATIETIIELGADNSLFGASVNTLNYDFEYWLFNTNRSEQTLTYDKDGNPQNSGIKTTKSSSGSLYRLDINISQNVTNETPIEVLLKRTKGNVTQYMTLKDYKISYDSNLTNSDSVRTLSGGKHSFYLYTYNNESLIGSEISLFTGPYNAVKYINGLTLENVCKAKNIKYDTSKPNKYTPKLDGTKNLIYDTTYKVPYQATATTNIQITFNEYGETDDDKTLGRNYAFDKKSYTLYVTPKYTGIDTSSAYATSIHYCYDVDFSGSKFNTVTGGLETGIDNIDLNVWAKGFKLISGVGISAILSQNEEKTLYGKNGEVYNKESLYFEAGNVFDTSGSQTSEGKTIFDVSTDGKISLKQGFIPNDYYISVRVFCKYGENNEGKIELATLYVQFVSVETVVVTNTNNEYNEKLFSFNIPESFVKTLTDAGVTITKDNIILGSIKVDSFDSSNNRIIIDDTNKAMENDRMYNLIIDKYSIYIKFNIKPHQFSNVSLSVNNLGGAYSFEPEAITLMLGHDTISLINYINRSEKQLDDCVFTLTFNENDNANLGFGEVFTFSYDTTSQKYVANSTQNMVVGQYILSCETLFTATKNVSVSLN